MSKTIEFDALSDILHKTRLTAQIYARPDYCGAWAVDTSGQRKVAFHLIQQGSAWLHLDDGSDPAPLITGDLVVFPHDARHALSSSSKRPGKNEINHPPPEVLSGPVTSLLCGFFEFRDKAAYQLLDGLPDVVRLDLRGSGAASGTVRLLQLIIGELTRNEPGTEAVINELAHVLFIHILRSQMATGVGEGLLSALADKEIGKAINLIHAELGTDWSVERLAGAVAMSRSAFAKKFKALVGMSPKRYVASWRMSEARNLLEQTKLPMMDIAARVGYQSDAAFRKAFKSLTGETPGRIRRRKQSRQAHPGSP